MSSQLVDLHCHILPGIDDGAKNLDVSMSLIQKEMEDGVVGIVFTPHFHYERITLDAFVQQRKWLIAALWRSWQNANFPCRQIGCRGLFYHSFGQPGSFQIGICRVAVYLD